MRVHILGGGNEVGASMTLVETAAGNVVVDCGIRMSGSAASATPDLSAAEATGVDVIAITHAHLDHTGALPLLHSAMRGVPVFCTAPTAALMRVLLLDAVKIMDERLAREEELPLYPLEAVESLLANIKAVPMGATVMAGREEKLAIRFLPAGHILGAAMVEISGPGVSVLVTGDISQADQHTVSGLAMPRKSSHVMIAESTYGGRLHTDRTAEENRFIGKAREVLGRGGKLIVPAFALGRAQELLLVLIRALRRGDLPPVPVYADGMVRSICQVYSRFSNYLPPFARKLTQKHGNPFFGVLESVQEVSDPRQRDAIVSGPPCIIVASSGMLTGGASVYYAQRLAGNPLNCIAITGYQDEESPGRRLLELADGEADSIVVDGRGVQVSCEVTRYGLSAHIDGYSLLQLAARLAPAHIVWVHGDAGAREWLHNQSNTGESRLVVNGDVLEFAAGKGQSRPPSRASGGDVPLSVDKLPVLAEALRREGRDEGVYKVSALLDRWHGAGGWGLTEEATALEALEATNQFEAVPRGREVRFRLRSREEALAAVAGSFGPANPQVVADEVERLFPPDTGCYRAKRYDAERRVSLTFNFPRIAEARYGAQLAELQERTGWRVEVYPQPNLEEVLGTARAMAGECTQVAKAGFNPGLQSVIIKAGELPAVGKLAELREKFREATGYDLRLDVGGPAAPSPKGSAPAGRMEINEAFSLILAAFEGSEVPPLKKSKRMGPDGEYIELRFVTPQAGERQAGFIDSLMKETGWTIVVSPNVTPNELHRLAGALVPAGCDLHGQARVFAQDRKVVLRHSGEFEAAELAAALSEFERLTGFILKFEGTA